MSEGAESWVTLATNDSYAMGALVLARSLRRVNTTKTITLMITPGVSDAMKNILTDVFDVVTEVNILDSADAAHLALLERPELGITFTKIHCWNLTQFKKCVFLDADTLVLQNCDELFEREELSAAPDAGWPDCFNSGVFVFRPSVETYNNIHSFALSHGSFDGGDQGLLNMYFNGWSQAEASRRLPFIYNMVATASYSYLPAFKVFGQNVKIVHFIGLEKPWLIYYDTNTGLVRPPGGQEHMQNLLQAWWNIFRSEVHPRLSPEMKGIAAIYAKMSLEGDKSIEQIEYEDHMRKQAWEQGHIDYMGRDSFDNIMKRIQASMAQTSVSKPQRKQTPPKQETTPVATPEPPKPEPTPVAQPPPKQEPAVIAQPPPKQEPEPTAPPKEEATTQKQAPATEQPVPKQESAQQTQVPTSAAPEQSTPKQQPTETASAAKEEPVPVVEPIIVATKAQTKAATPTPQETAQEKEDKKAQEEREALEKKLAEQKKVAEQHLEAEKKAAASRASAAAKEEPKAPPRKESQTGSELGKAMPYGMGLGILGAAVIVVFAIYAAYSPTR